MSSRSQRLSGPPSAYLNSAPDPIVVVDRAGTIVFFSAQAEQMFGYSAAETIDQSVDMLLPARLRSGHAAHRNGYSAAPRIRSMGAAESELIAVDSSGREFPVEISLSPVQIEGELTVMAAVRDITTRLEHEQRLRESEQFFRALGDIRAAILSEQGSPKVLTRITNHASELWPGATAMLAMTDADGSLRVRSTAGPVPPAAVGDILDTRATAIGAALRTRSTIGEGTEAVTIIAPLLGIHRTEGVLVVSTAEHVRVDMKMVEAFATEAAVSIEIEHAAQERRRQLVTTDRERIARDLHDLVIQRLFAAGMRLQSALGSPSMLDERARDVVHELDETISEIRNTIFKLTEPDTSLREQLRVLVDTFVPPPGTRVALSVGDGVEGVPDDVAAHLLATVNEAVSNSLRHADATTIEVNIGIGDHLVLTVTDDGCGIGRVGHSGRGMTNMAERAGALDGEIAFQPREGGGTQMVWRVPLEES